MNQVRFFAIYVLMMMPVNALARALLWDSFGMVALTAAWSYAGAYRIFRLQTPAAATSDQAVRTVVMMLAWPLLPPSSR